MHSFFEMLLDTAKALADPTPARTDKSIFPFDRKEDENVSNFDHEIPEGLEDRIRKGNTCLHYAWNFCGHVWFDGEQFCNEVWVHRIPQEVLRAATLREVIEAANDAYGYD